MALPPFPPKPPNDDPENEGLLPPVGLGAIFQAKPTTPEINVEDILKHFATQRQEQIDRAFDPFLLAENVIGGAVRGAFNPEESGAPVADPVAGALYGAYKALPKTLEELAPYAPGGAAPDTEKSFGEPFKVGKKLAPNSPVGAAAIGTAIGFAVPGPDFFKLLKEGKAAEIALNDALKIRSYPGRLLEVGRSTGNVVIHDIPIRSTTVLSIPQKGVKLQLNRKFLNTLAPLDPDFAHAAIANAFRLVGFHSVDPATLLKEGHPVPIALLPRSKYAESLRSPLKAMAANPKTSDNLLQLVQGKGGYLRWIIYEPGNPKKFVTYTLPKPYDDAKFPELDKLVYDKVGYSPDFKEYLPKFGNSLLNLLPTRVVSAEFDRAASMKHVSPIDAFNVTVLDSLDQTVKINGRAIPVVSEQGLPSAIALQLVRRATREVPPDTPVKIFSIPVKSTSFSVQTIFDRLPEVTPNTATVSTPEELLRVVEENPKILNRPNFGRTLSQIAASDIMTGRQGKLFSESAKLHIDLETGDVVRELHPVSFSKGIEKIDLMKAPSTISFIGGSNDAWHKIAEKVGLEAQIHDTLQKASARLNVDEVFQQLTHISRDFLNSSAGWEAQSIVTTNINRAEGLPTAKDGVSVLTDSIKQTSYVAPFIKIDHRIVDPESTLGTQLKLESWRIHPKIKQPIGATETLVDQAAKFLGDKAASKLHQKLQELVDAGTLSPAYLMTPADLAPQLINQSGKFTAAVDVQNAAQGFKNFVETRLPQILDKHSAGEFMATYSMHLDDFPKGLFNIAEYYRKLSKEDPEMFARLSGLVATLQKGQTQSELARFQRNQEALKALQKAGIDIHFTDSGMVKAGEIKRVSALGRSWDFWPPTTIANMLTDPAKVDEMFEKYAHELPAIKLRRVTDGELFRAMATAQIPGLRSLDKFTDEWIGITLKDGGYTATSFNPGWGVDHWPDGNTLLDFIVPEGVKGVVPGLLADSYASESEVVLARNQPWRIIDVGEDEESGFPKLTVEVLKNVGAGVVVAEIGASFLPPNPSRNALANKPPLEEEQ